MFWRCTFTRGPGLTCLVFLLPAMCITKVHATLDLDVIKKHVWLISFYNKTFLLFGKVCRVWNAYYYIRFLAIGPRNLRSSAVYKCRFDQNFITVLIIYYLFAIQLKYFIPELAPHWPAVWYDIFQLIYLINYFQWFDYCAHKATLLAVESDLRINFLQISMHIMIQ